MDDIYRAMKKEELKLDSIDCMRKEIDKLGNPGFIIRDFEKTSLLHKNKFIEKQDNNKKMLKITIINSKIKERQEINEKLKILLYHLSLLKATKLTKDYNAAKRCMHQFMTNNFTNVNAVLRDIDNFKCDIKELDKNYRGLLIGYPSTLDYKITREFGYKNLIDNLSSMIKKQKQLTAAIGKSFVNSSRDLLNDLNYRSFINNKMLW